MVNKLYLVFITGFALFSMFFGSGNLVFPIMAGQETSGKLFFSSVGFLLTGVAVPFLGVFGMLLYKGDLSQFFNCLGKRATFWFSLFALAIMGPFGVLARCLTVAHGSLRLLLPDASLPITSLLLCGVIFLLTVNKNKIVTLLGTILTPLLLLSLAAIAFFGLKEGGWPIGTTSTGWEALKFGFFQGYQTMDLLAAFFFSTFVIKHLQKFSSSAPDGHNALRIFLQSSLFGATVLSLVYIALVALGGKHADLLINTPPQEMLGAIAVAVLGPIAAPAICLTVVLACLTTAIVLTSLFADFLQKEVSNKRLGNKRALLITLAISFLISTLDFAGIASFLGPILETIYPALIMLTLVNLTHKLLGTDRSHWPVTFTLAAKLCI